ncbi:hypothetical protein O181_053219 [Austropuccinia psidii MF-1]|uniref:Uncharacterized protein n=1 Tax=Austropuccinia psidii MF-1 TaxID=1389203 RepID=A0A9Q3HSF5_9BASI|nr:hypothetical protein [Austropuccinia psidii MF-1]
MATSTTYTEQRPNTSQRGVIISSQIPTALHQEAQRNTTPIVKIGVKDYSLWLNGKDVERLTKKSENIAEIEGESRSKIARQIAFLPKMKKSAILFK